VAVFFTAVMAIEKEEEVFSNNRSFRVVLISLRSPF
jgi:hypothetical protein